MTDEARRPAAAPAPPSTAGPAPGAAPPTAPDAAAAERARARATRDAWKLRWAPALGLPLLSLLGSTWRVEEERHPEFAALLAAGRPHLLAVWHGHLLGAVWANRYRGICAMASQHGDGEIITRVMRRWGYRHVRGSSSRGGREALIEMIRELERGSVFAITPDGPRGPAGVPQPGVLVASRRTGVPIVPLRVDASRAWFLASWDRFRVPKPFSHVRVTYGAPWVATGVDEAARAEFSARMGPAIPADLPPVRRARA
ncbi:MAG: lysophospholipid acyltransferase family protein [Gemmatimonadaceae bacterium]|nr:lysophospholipid acyltransferase family protein [Gemmatimonadaceae bacterium]